MNLCQAQQLRAHSRTVIRAQISYNPAGYAFPIDDYQRALRLWFHDVWVPRSRASTSPCNYNPYLHLKSCRQVVRVISVERELLRVRWERVKPARSRMGGRNASIPQQGAYLLAPESPVASNHFPALECCSVERIGRQSRYSRRQGSSVFSGIPPPHPELSLDSLKICRRHPEVSYRACRVPI